MNASVTAKDDKPTVVLLAIYVMNQYGGPRLPTYTHVLTAGVLSYKRTANIMVAQ